VSENKKKEKMPGKGENKLGPDRRWGFMGRKTSNRRKAGVRRWGGAIKRKTHLTNPTLRNREKKKNSPSPMLLSPGGRG